MIDRFHISPKISLGWGGVVTISVKEYLQRTSRCQYDEDKSLRAESYRCRSYVHQQPWLYRDRPSRNTGRRPNLNLKGRLSTLYIPRLCSQPNHRGLYRAVGNAYVQFTQMYSLWKTALRRIQIRGKTRCTINDHRQIIPNRCHRASLPAAYLNCNVAGE